ncbi:MAG: HAD family hydrolase [Erysipelotrichales bacterium]|nr:HAD family hydrolase [Erysipelotrichales bacterium]
MIQAVFFDVDGTLYDSNSEYVNYKSLEAIKQLHKQGYILGLCTGRTRDQLLGVPKEILELPFDVFLTCGGGEGFLHSGEALFHMYFSSEEVAKIMKLEEIRYENELDLICIDDEGTAILWECGEQGMINFTWFKIPVAEIRDIDPGTLSHVLISCDASKHESVKPYLNELNYFVSSASSIDILPAGVNKATAIAKAVAHFGFTMENVMVFGDSYNDIEMLREAKIGVCMGNGSDDAKEAADYVCESMWEDGIAKFLAKM